MSLGYFHCSNTTLLRTKTRQLSKCLCILYRNINTKVVPTATLFKKQVQTKLQPFCRVKFITRSKKTFTLSVDKLPNISKKPHKDNLYKGPEWDSTVGKAVRLAQLEYPDCVILTRVGSFWEVIFK
jgi:hypothetical protein